MSTSKVQVLLSKRLVDVVDGIQKRIDDLKANARAIEFIEAKLGRELAKDQYDIAYPSFEISREELPAIRQAVGRLTVDGKSVPYDYKTKGEIEVTVRAHDKDLSSVRFRYRTKLRDSAKCKVVEQKTTYNTLVCGT